MHTASGADTSDHKVAIITSLNAPQQTEGSKLPKQSLGQHLFPKIEAKECSEIPEASVIVGVPSDVTAIDIIDMLQNDAIIDPNAASESAIKVSLFISVI